MIVDPRRLGIRLLFFGFLAGVLARAAGARDWPQWGGNPAHQGASAAAGQPLVAVLADIVYDPFVELEKAESGRESARPLRRAVCSTQRAFIWCSSRAPTSPAIPPVPACLFPADPTPGRCRPGTSASSPGKTARSRPNGPSRATGSRSRREERWQTGNRSSNPPSPAIFSTCPASAERSSSSPRRRGLWWRESIPLERPWIRKPTSPEASPPMRRATFSTTRSAWIGSIHGLRDVLGAWLVKIAPDGAASTAPFSSLVPGAPAALAPCQTSFTASLPWPPSADAVPPASACGSQRPGINVIPAIAPDGTVYTVSRAHFNGRYAYLVAVHPDLTPAWSSSLRNVLERRMRRRSAAERDAWRLPCRLESRSGSCDQRRSGRTRLGPVVLVSGRASRRRRALRRLHFLQLLEGASLQVRFGRASPRDLRLRVGHHAGRLPARRNVFDPAQGQSLPARLLLRRPERLPSGDSPVRPRLARFESLREWRFTSTNTLTCARRTRRP